MMSQEAFMSLSKTQTWELLVDLNKKVQEKINYITMSLQIFKESVNDDEERIENPTGGSLLTSSTSQHSFGWRQRFGWRNGKSI